MSTHLKQIRQLDSLRAFAAFSVVIFHFLPEYRIGSFSIGWIGVDLFFVISGYLITAILLKQKEAIQNRLHIIRNFMIKRILRLFPAYYFFITFFLLLKLCTTLYIWDNGNAWFYYSYTQNFLYFFEGFKAIQLNHLWSLAIEEQFYLFWPWIVLYVSGKSLLRILLVLIPGTLLIYAFMHIEADTWRMLPTSHIHTLGTGALIALIQHMQLDRLSDLISRYRSLIIFSTSVVFLFEMFRDVPDTLLAAAIIAFSWSVITGCREGFRGFAGKLLDLPFLQYLGRISYGIYLYHKPIPWLTNLVCNKMHIVINKPVVFILSIAATGLIAHFSYILIELPFLRMKNRFEA